jgi:hypothetical protein
MIADVLLFDDNGPLAAAMALVDDYAIQLMGLLGHAFIRQPGSTSVH